MPNKAAGKKALRQTKKHAAANLVRKEAFRSAIKKTLKSATVEEAMKMVIAAQKALDKAAKAGTIKKNTAARKLSRLMKKVHAMKK
jgi:small subunit ribosomal protein S20